MKHLIIILLFCVACNRDNCDEQIIQRDLECTWVAQYDGELTVKSNSCAYIIEVNGDNVFSGWERNKYVSVKKDDKYIVKRYTQLIEQGDSLVLVSDTGLIELTYRNKCPK